jgi:hypothetical protein
MSPLVPRLLAIVVVTPLVVLVVHACLIPFRPVSVTLGFVPAVVIILVAGDLAFSFLKESTGRFAAGVGALIVAAVTLFLSVLLLVGVWGA